jgi:isopenicillin-N N-acyltransferase-like protein
VAIPFVHVQAKGDYRELGRAVGEAAREQVRASVEFFVEHFEAMTRGRLTFAAAEAQAAAYGAHAKRWLPQYVDELEGVAEGAGLPYSHLLVLNCGEELTSDEPVAGEAGPDGATVPGEGAGDRGPGVSGEIAGPEGPHGVAPRDGDHCTAAAVAAGGRHVIGHDMDWYVIDAPNNVLFDFTVPDGTRVMGIAGAPYLLMLGMNSHGVGNVSNSVHSTDDRVGVPNAFVRRWTLEAKTLEEARTRGLLATRARGTNHVFADTDGRLWDIETSATSSAFADHSAARFMAHTNHYASPAMASFEGSRFEESRVRLATAERLLAEGLGQGQDPVALVAQVLRSHERAPGQAICGHPDESQAPAAQGMTVGSMVCDLDERRIHVCAGPPCENPYEVFSL